MFAIASENQLKQNLMFSVYYVNIFECRRESAAFGIHIEYITRSLVVRFYVAVDLRDHNEYTILSIILYTKRNKQIRNNQQPRFLQV